MSFAIFLRRDAARAFGHERVFQPVGGGPAADATHRRTEHVHPADAAAAAQKRRKLSALEQAQFGGSAGTSQGALARERQGSF